MTGSSFKTKQTSKSTQKKMVYWAQASAMTIPVPWPGPYRKRVGELKRRCTNMELGIWRIWNDSVSVVSILLLCLLRWCGRLQFCMAHVMITVWIACATGGCDHITDNELRRERLDLKLVSYGLLYQRIFVFDMTLFKHRHFKLS